MQDEEVWRAVPGYEGDYEVSNLGRVRSFKHSAAGRLLAAHPAGTRGYPTVILCGKKRVNAKVHHLVLLAFVGPRPPGLMGLHGDDDPTNNRVENLRWDTQASNEQDKVRNFRASARQLPTPPPFRKLRPDQALAIRADDRSLSRIAAAYGVSVSCIAHLKQNRTWRNL